MILYSKDINHISVPQYETLKMEAMLEFAKSFPKVYLALPSEEREIQKLHRQYVANLIYTIVGAPFKKWIDAMVEARNIKIIEE